MRIGEPPHGNTCRAASSGLLRLMWVYIAQGAGSGVHAVALMSQSVFH